MNREHARIEAWVASLKEQHPNHVDVIEKAVEEGMKDHLESTDLGDHVLGRLEEEGAVV